MTWVSNEQANIQKKKQPGFLGGLLGYLESPEGIGMLQALGEDSGWQKGPVPISWGQTFAKGQKTGQVYQNENRKRNTEEGTLKETSRHNRATEDLSRITKDIALAKAQQEQRRQDLWAGILNPGMNTGDIQGPDPSATGGMLNQTPDSLVTVQDPSINGGAPSNIPATSNGAPIAPDQAIQQAAFLQGQGAQFPAYGTVEEAQAASNQAAQPVQEVEVPGILNAEPLQPVQSGEALPPQPQPTQPFAPPSGGGGGGDDLVPITMNGHTHMIPRRNVAQAYAHLAAGNLEKVPEALFPNLTDAEKKLLAAGMRPGSREWNDALVRNVTKPPVEVNLGEKASEQEQKLRIANESDMIKTAREGYLPAREGSNLAEQSYSLIRKLQKRGFDPARYDFSLQLPREKIASILGSQASNQDISDFEVLNKNMIKMQIQAVKGLPARAITQYESQLIAKSVGMDVPLSAAEKMMVSQKHGFVEKQFGTLFMQKYKQKYGDLEGFESAFSTWMDTLPEIKSNKEGSVKWKDDREIEADMNKWIGRPDSKEFKRARFNYIDKKADRFGTKGLTEEELQFFVEHS